MTLEQLQNWAQAQINNTAIAEVRPDIGVSVLQLVDELERLHSLHQGAREKVSILCHAEIIASILFKINRCRILYKHK